MRLSCSPFPGWFLCLLSIFSNQKVKCPPSLPAPAPLCQKRETGEHLSPSQRMNPTFASDKSLLQGSLTTPGFLPLEMLSFYNCPIWGILVHFHRDHPQLLGTVLGWGELKFFSFTIYDILGCHGGLKAASVLSTEVTLLLHDLTSSLYQMGEIIEILDWKEHRNIPLLCGRVRKSGLFLTDVCIICSQSPPKPSIVNHFKI